MSLSRRGFFTRLGGTTVAALLAPRMEVDLDHWDIGKDEYVPMVTSRDRCLVEVETDPPGTTYRWFFRGHWLGNGFYVDDDPRVFLIGGETPFRVMSVRCSFEGVSVLGGPTVSLVSKELPLRPEDRWLVTDGDTVCIELPHPLVTVT